MQLRSIIYRPSLLSKLLFLYYLHNIQFTNSTTSYQSVSLYWTHTGIYKFKKNSFIDFIYSRPTKRCVIKRLNGYRSNVYSYYSYEFTHCNEVSCKDIFARGAPNKSGFLLNLPKAFMSHSNTIGMWILIQLITLLVIMFSTVLYNVLYSTVYCTVLCSVYCT